MVVMKLAAVYLAFGTGYVVVRIAYCNYRVNAGNPPDVPCVDLPLTSMELLFWPLGAFGDAMTTGETAVVPASWYRTTGIAFLVAFVVAFVATIVWVFRKPHRGGSTG
jgi:hypothetical protein